MLTFRKSLCALGLMAGHDLATSTFGVRVAASTRADPGAVVCAGLNVLSGPLHGSASRHCRAMLQRAGEVGPARAVSEVLTRPRGTGAWALVVLALLAFRRGARRARVRSR